MKALSRKQLEGISVTDLKDLETRVALTIRIFLVVEVIYHVMDKESATTI